MRWKKKGKKEKREKSGYVCGLETKRGKKRRKCGQWVEEKKNEKEGNVVTIFSQ